MRNLTFALEPVPPFRLDLTVRALRRRPHNAIDWWDSQTYRRVIVLNGESMLVSTSQVGPPETPRLQVTVKAAQLVPDVEAILTAALDRLLGLQIDLTAFYQFAVADERLGQLALRFRGFKPPRFPTLFETLLNAIACQQVTLTLGIQLLNRLATAYGAALAGDDRARYALPEPHDLSEADLARLRGLGFSGQKARAMIEIARACTEGWLKIEELAALDDAAAVEHLRQLRGVGRWTAEYALLRGLGRLHVFPHGDIGAYNNLRRWLDLPASLSNTDVHRLLDRWHPYAGLIYLHLLLDRLAELYPNDREAQDIRRRSE